MSLKKHDFTVKTAIIEFAFALGRIEGKVTQIQLSDNLFDQLKRELQPDWPKDKPNLKLFSFTMNVGVSKIKVTGETSEQHLSKGDGE